MCVNCKGFWFQHKWNKQLGALLIANVVSNWYSSQVVVPVMSLIWDGCYDLKCPLSSGISVVTLKWVPTIPCYDHHNALGSVN